MIFFLALQDPLMRRIEGAPIIPPGALLHSEIPVGHHRRNRISEWVSNFQFRAKKIDVISRYDFLSFLIFGEIAFTKLWYLFQGPVPLHLLLLQHRLLDLLPDAGEREEQKIKNKRSGT